MSRKDLILITVSGVLLVLAFAPFSFGFLSYIALVPLFCILKTGKPAHSFRAGYLTGFFWASGTLYWIAWPTPLGLLGVLLVLPTYCGIFSCAQSWLHRRWGEKSLWAAPFLWAGMEVFSSLGQLAFPWNLLGNTQASYPQLIQYASITGVFGISFWVVLLNVLVFFGFEKRENLRTVAVYFSAAFLVVLLSYTYGLRVLSRPLRSVTTLRVGLVQGNINAYKKWTPSFIDSNFVIYSQMTLECAKNKPEMIVWPETATPCYLRYRNYYLNWVKAIVDSVSVPLLTGTPDYEWTTPNRVKTYNAAFLFTPLSENIQRYCKKQLVPFAEKVPFSEAFPRAYAWLNRIIPDVGDYSCGDSATVFLFRSARVQRVPFSTVICFESIFPDLVSRFVSAGAGFLVVITNDGWFGNTSGPYQHSRIALLRAVENRRWVVRCANTGISEFVDPFGRVTQQTRLNESAVLTQTIQLNTERTFYTRHANGWLWTFFACNVLILGSPLFKHKTGKGRKGTL